MTTESQPDVSLRKQYLTWRYGILNVLYILIMHAVLVGWLWYGRELVPYGIYIVSALLVCAIFLRMLSEWFHEAAHWNIVPGRALNDLVGDLLIGTMIGTRVKSNRPGHFAHHAMTTFFIPDDPDTIGQAVINRKELVGGILRDLCGYTTIAAYLDTMRMDMENSKNASIWNVCWFVWLAIVHGTGVVLTVRAGHSEIYPIYVIGVLCLYPVTNRFRLFTQHAWLRQDGSVYLVNSGASRTYHGSLLVQLFLISPMIMYHYEHHARPTLPYRALRAISRRSDDPNKFGTRPFRMLGTVLTRL